MNRFNGIGKKSLLHWSLISRMGLALALSAVMWFFVLGVTYS
jgi:hypothetical protein